MPDEAGVLTKQERETWGPLGPMPYEIMSGKPELIAQWKRLADRALKVSRMPHSFQKARKAKRIQHERESLVAIARGEKE